MNQCSTWNINRLHEVRAVNPQMSAPQPRCTTVINDYHGNGIGQSVLAKENKCSYYAWTVIEMRPATARPPRLLAALPGAIPRQFWLWPFSPLPRAWAAAECNTRSAGRNR